MSKKSTSTNDGDECTCQVCTLRESLVSMMDGKNSDLCARAMGSAMAIILEAVPDPVATMAAFNEAMAAAIEALREDGVDPEDEAIMDEIDEILGDLGSPNPMLVN